MKRQMSSYRARAESALGRPLTSQEHVHHHSKTQLVICTGSYHAWLHARMRDRGIHTDKPIFFIIRDIPPDLWLQFKVKAFSQGLTLKAAVYQALQNWLQAGEV